MQTTLTKWRNELKKYGINGGTIAKQNNISRQWLSLIFKYYSPPYLSYQLFLLEKAIDIHIKELEEKLEKDIEELREIKRQAKNFVNYAIENNVEFVNEAILNGEEGDIIE